MESSFSNFLRIMQHDEWKGENKVSKLKCCLLSLIVGKEKVSFLSLMVRFEALEKTACLVGQW